MLVDVAGWGVSPSKGLEGQELKTLSKRKTANYSEQTKRVWIKRPIAVTYNRIANLDKRFTEQPKPLDRILNLVSRSRRRGSLHLSANNY